jgi:HPt (histidine-containing phosphotransfer) domain-containing protein
LHKSTRVLQLRTNGGIVDTSGLVALCHEGASLDVRLLREMFDLFDEEVAGRVHDLVEALAEDDRKAMREAAHSIKGSAGAIGATSLRHLAGDLEHESKVAPRAMLATAIGALHEEFSEVSRAIRALHPELFQ